MHIFKVLVIQFLCISSFPIIIMGKRELVAGLPQGAVG